MSARAMWRTAIVFRDHRIPVKLYAGVEDRAVRFRLLCARHGVPVVQQMFEARSDSKIDADAIRRAVQLEPGLFVVLDENEQRQEAAPSRAIEVAGFAPQAAIDAARFERTYFLGPDGDAASYAALRDALAAEKRCGIARWTLRKQRYVGAVGARGTHLALFALRPQSEVFAAGEWDADGAPVRGPERALAAQLVDALAGPFEASLLRDVDRERLHAYLAARAKGHKTVRVAESVPEPSRDLARALRQSLQAVRKGSRAA
jgi:DNA end-binding protein Ku